MSRAVFAVVNISAAKKLIVPDSKANVVPVVADAAKIMLTAGAAGDATIETVTQTRMTPLPIITSSMAFT